MNFIIFCFKAIHMWLRKIISPKLSFFGRKVTLLDQISEGGYGFVFDAID